MESMLAGDSDCLVSGPYGQEFSVGLGQGICSLCCSFSVIGVTIVIGLNVWVICHVPEFAALVKAF